MNEIDLARAVVVIGAGGHAKVAIEALRHSGWNVVGCTDPDGSSRQVVGADVLGDDSLLPELRSAGIRFAFPALGNNAVRERIGRELIAMGFELPNALGPQTIVSPSAKLGVGVAIFAGAVINAEAAVGDFAIINTNASVDHDCVIGSAAHIAPGCALAGCVKIGDRAFVGAGSSVIPNIEIGTDSTVGAGSSVVRDIPSGVTAFGVPARAK
ncbi:acetyltransferase [Sphingomonas sinipercae]|uniref:Acetyltransferase n=1 Tax=Sphingomonas sinipercae TaxID=2714944 RepID=A0A6G7ZKD5_9SPHN|nr:acetyltransferase [Sphingomonas sinipercae]QIL01457.1 acetyltransferase [Sphingomonas sinipercae]